MPLRVRLSEGLGVTVVGAALLCLAPTVQTAERAPAADSSFSNVVPLLFGQGSEKGMNFVEGPVPLCPLDVFLEPQHLHHRRGVMPCGQDQRQGWLPACTYATTVWKQFIEIVPLLRLRAHTPVPGGKG